MTELFIPAIVGLLGVVIGGYLNQRREDRKSDREIHLSFLERRLSLYSNFSKSYVQTKFEFSDFLSQSSKESVPDRSFSSQELSKFFETLGIIQLSCEPKISEACRKVSNNIVRFDKWEDRERDFEAALELMRNDILKIEHARTVSEYFAAGRGFWGRLVK